MKTTAAILEETGGDLVVAEVELDRPGPGEVLVRMVGSGICHTDVSAMNGSLPAPPPIVLGHEGSGVVEEVGPGVRTVAPGDHVVLSVGVHCGVCDQCLAGRPWACSVGMGVSFAGIMPDGTKRLHRDGADVSHFFCQSSWARHAVVPAEIAVKVPADAPLEKLGPLGCGVQTGAGAVLNVAGVRPGDTVAVIGCGGVGLSAVMAAAASGATTIVAVDIDPRRLELAKSLGATDGVDASAADPVEAVQGMTGGGADYAFECLGRSETIGQTVGAVRQNGTAVITGALGLDVTATFDTFTLISKNIKGNVGGTGISEDLIPRLVRMWRRGIFPFDRLSPRTYRLEEVNTALADMHAGDVVKPLIAF